MADPDRDHGFVYTEGEYVDILASPFFDVHPGVDTTVNGYIERIRYTLVKSLEVHLGVFPRDGPEDDDYPLHPSYVALQTLYQQPRPSGPSPVADLPVPSGSSSGYLPVVRYLCGALLVVAFSILVRFLCYPR